MNETNVQVAKIEANPSHYAEQECTMNSLLRTPPICMSSVFKRESAIKLVENHGREWALVYRD